MRVFGSRARGEAGRFSDLDLRAAARQVVIDLKVARMRAAAENVNHRLGCLRLMDFLRGSVRRADAQGAPHRKSFRSLATW